MVKYHNSDPAEKVFQDMAISAEALSGQFAHLAQAAGEAALNTLPAGQQQELAKLTREATRWFEGLQQVNRSLQNTVVEAAIYGSRQLTECDLYERFIDMPSMPISPDQDRITEATITNNTTIVIGGRSLTLFGDELCIFNCMASNRIDGVTTLTLRQHFRREPGELEVVALRRLNSTVPFVLHKVNALAPDGDTLIKRTRAGGKGYRYVLHEGLQFIDMRTPDENVEEISRPPQEQQTEEESLPPVPPQEQPTQPTLDTWCDLEDIVALTGASYGAVQSRIDAHRHQFGSLYVTPEHRVSERTKSKVIGMRTLHFSPQLTRDIISELRAAAED